MKNLKPFLLFESGPGDGDALDSIANSVVTGKDFERRDLYYERDNFKRALRSLGVTDKTTVAKLAQHPKFDELDSKYKKIIHKRIGSGKSPNQEFVKLFVAAMEKFPHFGGRDASDLEAKISTVNAIRKDLEADEYPKSYYGLEYKDSKALGAIIQSWDIQKTLTKEEVAFLKKICKPEYEDAIKRYLTDESIERMIIGRWKDEFPEHDHNDTSGFVSEVRLKKDMPDLFEFMKNEILTNGISYKEWPSLKVKSKMVDSKHSEVHSSSFSTYYHYDVDVTFMGKEFSAKDIVLGSSHYSGGWN